MTERDATRAQAEAVHQAQQQEIRNERRTTRMDETVQSYLASAYYAIASRQHRSAARRRRGAPER